MNLRIERDLHKALRSFLNDIEDNKKIHITLSRNVDNGTYIYFLIENMDDNRYNKGLYFGLLKLSNEHPNKPPNFYMLSKTGRFKVFSNINDKTIENDKGICFTFTSFHSDEWSPIQNVESLIRSFISFFMDDQDREYVGAITTNDEEKIKIAFESPLELKHNELFKKYFPEYETKLDSLIEERKLK